MRSRNKWVTRDIRGRLQARASLSLPPLLCVCFAGVNQGLVLGKCIPPSLLLVHQTLSVSGSTPTLCGTGLPPPPSGVTLLLDCNNSLASVQSLTSWDAQKPASHRVYLCLSEFSHGNWGMCGEVFSPPWRQHLACKALGHPTPWRHGWMLTLHRQADSWWPPSRGGQIRESWRWPAGGPGDWVGPAWLWVGRAVDQKANLGKAVGYRAGCEETSMVDKV